MTALTENRSTKQMAAGDRSGLLGANQTIYSGALLMRNAAGQIIKGATATGSFGVGRAEVSGGSTTAGVTPQPFREGVFQYANSAAGDLIATADGEIEPAEMTVLKEIGLHFGLRPQDYGVEI